MKVLVSILMVAFLAGCASFQTTSGKTLASIALTADAAMQGWAQWVAKGQANASQEAQVKAAYERYQVAMALAKTAYANASIANDKTAMQQAIDILTTNKTTLVNLITSFQTNTQTP